MEIKILEEYDGELEEKQDEIIKALFPSKETEIKVPVRDFRVKAFADILNKLKKEYKEQMKEMYKHIDAKLLEFIDKK